MSEPSVMRDDLMEALLADYGIDLPLTDRDRRLIAAAQTASICWAQEPGSYTACDRVRLHGGQHSWNDDVDQRRRIDAALRTATPLRCLSVPQGRDDCDCVTCRVRDALTGKPT